MVNNCINSIKIRHLQRRSVWFINGNKNMRVAFACVTGIEYHILPITPVMNPE